MPKRIAVLAAAPVLVALATSGLRVAAAAPSTSATPPAATVDAIQDRILGLERTAEDIRAELVAIQSRLEVTNDRIFRKREQLHLARERLDKARASFDARIVILYKARTANPISMLLESRSISEFLSRAAMLSRIAEVDRRTVQDAELTAAEADFQASLLEDLKTQDLALRALQQQRLADLTEALGEQKTLLADADAAVKNALSRLQAEGAKTRKQWRESSLPLDDEVQKVPAVVEPYLDRTYLVAYYQPKRYQTTGERYSAVCSWYGNEFHGRSTASGQIYNQNDFTCASRTLPFGTRLALTRENKRIVVVVNDRGPFIAGRDLDLSRASARALGFSGVATVELEVVTALP